MRRKLSKRKAVSPIVAVLLVAIAVASGVVVYSWVMGLIGVSTPSATSKGSMYLVIESAVVETSLSCNPYLAVYIRNQGDQPVTITAAFIYDVSTKSLLAKCTVVSGLRKKVIAPKSVDKVRFISDRQLNPRTYMLKVTASEGASTSTVITFRKTLFKSIIGNITTANTITNKVTYEDAYARYEFWVESVVGGNYKLNFRIYAKPGVTIQKVYGECFASDGEHPDWVGGNPWEWTTPYTYPNWAGAEWWPIRPDEFPVFVVFSIEV